MPKIYINDVIPGKLIDIPLFSCIKYQEQMIKDNERLEAASHYSHKLKFVTYSEHFTMNPLIAAIHIAFDKHVPVIITPDIIWNTIMQGISKHINENSEEFRHIFVTHKDKKTLEIKRDDFRTGNTTNKWQEVTKEFITKIIENCHCDSLNKAIKLRFTTTTSVQDAVHDMTFMDAVKSYFEYKMYTMCGIPYIDIQGTVDDWKNIKNSLNVLDELDLTSWKLKLHNILDHFIEVYDDVNDKKFWNSIYLFHGAEGGSGSVTTVSGWISDLFLYIDNKKIDYSIEPSFKESLCKYEPCDFPYGMITTPFIWNYFGKLLKMKFVSGLIGVRLADETTASIIPEMGWMVIENLE